MSDTIRTQFYLTAAEKKSLAEIAKSTGESQNKLIREAIRQFIKNHKEIKRSEIMRAAFGMWQDNKSDDTLQR